MLQQATEKEKTKKKPDESKETQHDRTGALPSGGEAIMSFSFTTTWTFVAFLLSSLGQVPRLPIRAQQRQHLGTGRAPVGRFSSSSGLVEMEMETKRDSPKCEQCPNGAKTPPQSVAFCLF